MLRSTNEPTTHEENDMHFVIMAFLTAMTFAAAVYFKTDDWVLATAGYILVGVLVLGALLVKALLTMGDRDDG